MSVLVIGGDDVRRLLPVGECIDVMAAALGALAAGDAVQPLRQVVALPGGGHLIAMPAQLGAGFAAPAVKVLTVFADNHEHGLASHQGAVLLFEGGRGRLVAIVDAAALTEIRTAAASGLATRLLAREDAGDLAILGSGVQARSHLRAMAAVRRLRRVRVWSRDPDHAAAFAGWARAELPACAVAPVASARDAVRGADLLCTVSAAREPIVAGADLAAGAHINAVGACLPTCRELDGAAVARARVFVDRRESALREAGDLLLALAEGAVTGDPIAGELGELVLGTLPGRRSADEITLFESLGLAVEDAAAAHRVFDRARELGAGTAVDL